jgi:hypothetical protein
VYTGPPLLDSGILNANSIKNLNIHTPMRLEPKMRGLAYRKPWKPARQSLYSEGFLFAFDVLYVHRYAKILKQRCINRKWGRGE